MANVPSGEQSNPPAISRRGEFALGGTAIAALIAGAFWLFGGNPAPIEATQQTAMLAPASLSDASPEPKLDHDDRANPTVAFMTAVSLAHVASLKLPSVAAVPGAKVHVVLVKIRVVPMRSTLARGASGRLPPRRPADLDSAGSIQAKSSPDTSRAAPEQLARTEPPPKLALVWMGHLGELVPTPQKVGRGIVWVGDSVGSLARKL